MSVRVEHSFGSVAELVERVARLESWAAAVEARVTRDQEAELLTSKQIAPRLGVTHPKTIERWVREKGLPCVRVGRNLRFRLGDVLRWLAQRKES